MQYGEGQDLARKIERRGFVVRYVHDVEVLHVGNVSNRQRWSSPERAARTAEAARANLAKHYPRGRSAAIRLITAAGQEGRLAVLGVMGETERAAVYRSMARVLLNRP
jgi:GT2 family glycosyltransferase